MFKRTVLAVVVSMLLISMLSITTYADDSCSISILPNFTQLEIAKGGREQVDLNGIFTDSKGHEMSYSLDESEESLKARIKDGVLLIDPLELGEFEIKITAKCEVSGDEKQMS